ncbi:hypothetical protein TCAL_06757 [Tigriopus californicus]|uniref:Major facilitator superfamily (MFS) profile domain-containing protein n=2 Tax=Tigriopus californicus TaxID=6832 RepID=A0A553PMD0_TIGCA|nr:oxalate:formate antiporter-like isoform X2 [Tigriopus californicus]XP_059095321.1 oxalate:formate antiporter-like isoform X2 [Tigriopus californicus]TRY78835.1 hypothetical protein TCAL_06757 [Tigriopus californicus]|eukprot:TCALIF_06757-PA protein Name:"Similar to oxlT Oxalate:formate antiporter (Oxalobacter formigenes)" AED:0.03 eAED:0.03 QI:35/1/0.5/1/1/1/2/0/489
MPSPSKIPWGGILALLGGFLIQLTLGSFYSFGNVMTYMTSYMRVHGSPNMTYGDFIVVQSVWGMTQGAIFPLSGFIIGIIGPRVAMFGGCFIFSLGSALTYWTLNHSLTMVAFTYGFVSAFGQGIALIPTMTIGMKWFPKRKGMAMGVIVGGFGGGAFIFNQIQTAILNPENVNIAESGYFEDEDLLKRVPGLMLILSAIYVSIQLVACLMVTEPPACQFLDNRKELDGYASPVDSSSPVESPVKQEVLSKESEAFELDITPREAIRRREFYILWLTRFSVVLVTQTIAGFYKAFGQTFIEDDHFLSLVGAICSIFNCSGRLFYGLLMDKTTYRLAMTTETVGLFCLFSTLYVTSILGQVGFAIWIWLIFLTFPGTYSTQPAVTVQTFGHKYGGTIYGFLFTSDIVNNLLVGILSKSILEAWGYMGLFFILAAFAAFAFIVTCFFPWNPSPALLRQKDEHIACEEMGNGKDVSAYNTPNWTKDAIALEN